MKRKYSIVRALNEMAAPKDMTFEEFTETLGSGGEAQWRFAQDLVNKLQNDGVDAWAQVVKGRGGNDIVLHVDDEIQRYEIKHLEKGKMRKKVRKNWLQKITKAIANKADKIPTLSGQVGNTPWIEFSGPFQDAIAALGGKFVGAKPSAKVYFGRKARTLETTYDSAEMMNNYRTIINQIDAQKGPFYDMFEKLEVTTGTLSEPSGEFIGLEGFSEQNTVYTYEEGITDLLDPDDDRERFHRAVDFDKRSALAGVILHKATEEITNELGEAETIEVAVLRYLDPARKSGVLCPPDYNVRLENPDPEDWAYFTIPKTTTFDKVMKDYLETQNDECFYAGGSWNFTGGKSEDMTFKSATQVPDDMYPVGVDKNQFECHWLVPKGAGRYDVKFVLEGAKTINLKELETNISHKDLYGYSVADQVGKREEFLLNKKKTK
jgi:hypothetical protein